MMDTSNKFVLALRDMYEIDHSYGIPMDVMEMLNPENPSGITKEDFLKNKPEKALCIIVGHPNCVDIMNIILSQRSSLNLTREEVRPYVLPMVKYLISGSIRSLGRSLGRFFACNASRVLSNVFQKNLHDNMPLIRTTDLLHVPDGKMSTDNILDHDDCPMKVLLDSICLCSPPNYGMCGIPIQTTISLEEASYMQQEKWKKRSVTFKDIKNTFYSLDYSSISLEYRVLIKSKLIEIACITKSGSMLSKILDKNFMDCVVVPGKKHFMQLVHMKDIYRYDILFSLLNIINHEFEDGGWDLTFQEKIDCALWGINQFSSFREDDVNIFLKLLFGNGSDHFFEFLYSDIFIPRKMIDTRYLNWGKEVALAVLEKIASEGVVDDCTKDETVSREKNTRASKMNRLRTRTIDQLKMLLENARS